MSDAVVFVDTLTTYVVFVEGDNSVVWSESPDTFLVFVEGAQGPSGVTSITWNETPSGTVDGANTTFTLAGAPASSTKLLLSLNGLLLKHGASNDFTLSSQTITFNAGMVPQSGDVLLATYSTA